MSLNYPQNLVTKPNTSNFSVGWQHASTQSVHIDYEPLNSRVSKESMRYTCIPIPYYQRSTVSQSYNLYYNSRNEKNIVSFIVEGRPCDTKEGKNLLHQTFDEIIREPLSAKHEPKTATIIYYDKEGVPKITRELHKCIITDVGLFVSHQERIILLKFTIQGLMEQGII